jgi:enamine deaminase RidA (YjgF/YER057c/UK114 family)
MTRRLIASGSTFETEVAYSRAVVDDDWIFVAGTTGFDYSTMSISSDVVEQTEQAFRNIDAALRRAGSALTDVVRVTYILPDAKEFPRCWPILRKYFGDIRPAATMISAGLVDERLRIEIEVTARRRNHDPALPIA